MSNQKYIDQRPWRQHDYVVYFRNSDCRWCVQKVGRERPGAVFPSREQAVREAIRLASARRKTLKRVRFKTLPADFSE